MKDLKGKRVLITGTASGIGRAVAFSFGARGSRLVLVDIDGAGLSSLLEELVRLGADASSYCIDVSSRVQVEELKSSVEMDIGGVDVLVNVAGVGIVGDIVDTTAEDWDWIVGVNLMGPIYTISAFLPGMIKRSSGHIVNVSSLGGLISHGLLGAYCTTKFGLVGLSEALYQEVRENNVGVTAFCPGLTDTPIVGHLKYRGYSSDKLAGRVKSIFKYSGALSAERTGELLVRAVEKKKPLVVTTIPGKIVWVTQRIWPGFIRFLMNRARRIDTRLYR